MTTLYLHPLMKFTTLQYYIIMIDDFFIYYLVSLLLTEKHITFNHTTTTQPETCAVQEHMSTIWERNSLLRQKCSLAKYRHVSTNVTFYHWKNLNYCKVPKCGSTFWMQVFLTLEKIKSVEDVFGSGRNQ